MAAPPIQYSGPKVSENVPWEIRQHIQTIYNKLANHTQAMSLLSSKTVAPTTTSTAIVAVSAGTSSTPTPTGTGGGGGGVPAGSGVPVSNHVGASVYTTQTGDDGAMIVLSRAAGVSVTLATFTPPWSAFITNLGSGSAVLTPQSGLINGLANITLAGSTSTLVVFDGTNFYAAVVSVVPQTVTAITHEWIASYDATSGTFALSQPSFADISGNLSDSQLPTDLFSGTIVTAALTLAGTTGSMTFINGSLQSQVAAT